MDPMIYLKYITKFKRKLLIHWNIDTWLAVQCLTCMYHPFHVIRFFSMHVFQSPLSQSLTEFNLVITLNVIFLVFSFRYAHDMLDKIF